MRFVRPCSASQLTASTMPQCLSLIPQTVGFRPQQQAAVSKPADDKDKYPGVPRGAAGKRPSQDRVLTQRAGPSPGSVPWPNHLRLANREWRRPVTAEQGVIRHLGTLSCKVLFSVRPGRAVPRILRMTCIHCKTSPGTEPAHEPPPLQCKVLDESLILSGIRFLDVQHRGTHTP